MTMHAASWLFTFATALAAPNDAAAALQIIEVTTLPNGRMSEFSMGSHSSEAVAKSNGRERAMMRSEVHHHSHRSSATPAPSPVLHPFEMHPTPSPPPMQQAPVNDTVPSLAPLEPAPGDNGASNGQEDLSDSPQDSHATADSLGNGASDDDEALSTMTNTTTTTPCEFIAVTSGTCAHSSLFEIPTVQLCESAAMALKLSITTAVRDGELTSTSGFPNCAWEDGGLHTSRSLTLSTLEKAADAARNLRILCTSRSTRCDSPSGIPNVHADGSCAEGDAIDTNTTCEARCTADFYPSSGTLACISGQLFPPTYTCHSKTDSIVSANPDAPYMKGVVDYSATSTSPYVVEVSIKAFPGENNAIPYELQMWQISLSYNANNVKFDNSEAVAPFTVSGKDFPAEGKFQLKGSKGVHQDANGIAINMGDEFYVAKVRFTVINKIKTGDLQAIVGGEVEDMVGGNSVSYLTPRVPYDGKYGTRIVFAKVGQNISGVEEAATAEAFQSSVEVTWGYDW